jgi:hypothetical protein
MLPYQAHSNLYSSALKFTCVFQFHFLIATLRSKCHSIYAGFQLTFFLMCVCVLNFVRYKTGFKLFICCCKISIYMFLKTLKYSYE